MPHGNRFLPPPAMFAGAAAVVIATGCATTPPPPAETPPATVVDEPEESTAEEMQHHFWDVAQARDAVINADLAGVSAPLLRIAENPVGDDIPEDWQSWIEDMQAQARIGARAATLHEAARVVANLSNTCAECHRATGAGPKLTEDKVTYRPLGEGLPERMHRHMWAAEALWAGLTAPQHQAWSRGARALAELTLPGEGASPSAEGASASDSGEAAETPAVEPSSPFAAKLDAIRQLGERADKAAQPAEKAAVYGDILVQCADCHAHARGRK